MLASFRSRSARTETESKTRRTARERGAAALEFALIAPLFFLVVFGGIELGFMFRSNLAVQDTARVAARVASVERSDPYADQAIMQRIQDRAGDLNGDIRRVVIFGAESLDSEVPAACTGDTDTAIASSQANRCNVYEVPAGGSLQDVIDAYTPPDPLNPAGLSAADRGPWDNIGVHIQYDYNYVTGFLDSITLGSTSVEVVELDL